MLERAAAARGYGGEATCAEGTTTGARWVLLLGKRERVIVDVAKESEIVVDAIGERDKC